jgi:hypothetical protein
LGVIYRWLANALVVFHLLVCLFFVVGGFICLAYPQLVVVHLPLALWVSAAFLFGWTCPLTPPEKWLRRKAGEEGYEGGFVSRYIFRPLGFAAAATGPGDGQPKSRRGEILLGLFFLALTLGVHAANWPKYRRLLQPEVSKPPQPGQTTYLMPFPQVAERK